MTQFTYKQTTRGDFMIMNGSRQMGRTDSEQIAQRFVSEQTEYMNEFTARDILREMAGGLSAFEQQKQDEYNEKLLDAAAKNEEVLNFLNGLGVRDYNFAIENDLGITILGEWNDDLHTQFKKRGIKWHGKGFFTHRDKTSNQFDYHEQESKKVWFAKMSDVNKIKLAFKAVGLV